METKSLPMPVVIGIIAVVMLLVGFFGWRAISGDRVDKNGVDLSRAGVQPGNGPDAKVSGPGYPGGGPKTTH